MCGMSQPISSVKATGLKIYNQQIYNRKKESDLTRLRHELAVVDGYDRRVRLPLGIDSLDRALAGGLALGRVHLLSGAMQTHGAVSGFTIALLCMLQDYLSVKKPTNNIQSINYPNQDTSPIIWCPASQRGGAGMLYGHGLAAAGLDPARLLIVDTPSPSRRLAALDDILRTEGLAAVAPARGGSAQRLHACRLVLRGAQRLLQLGLECTAMILHEVGALCLQSLLVLVQRSDLLRGLSELCVSLLQQRVHAQHPQFQHFPRH